jgi:mannose-6-phosphate isomerase-like protein (cupin superfamily)
MSMLRQEIISYDKYESGQLKVIGFESLLHTDCVVNTKFSYANWIVSHHKYPVIKVEGIETIKKIKRLVRFKIKNIHLFVSQKTSYSFNWHKDDVNVLLYVVRGYKKLQVKNKTYILTPGMSTLIPKRHLHRVFSKKDTWALSIGF